MFGTTASKPASRVWDAKQKIQKNSGVNRHYDRPVATIMDRGELLMVAVKGFDRNDPPFSLNFIFFLESFCLYLSLSLCKPIITKPSILPHLFSFLVLFHSKSSSSLNPSLSSTNFISFFFFFFFKLISPSLIHYNHLLLSLILLFRF